MKYRPQEPHVGTPLPKNGGSTISTGQTSQGRFGPSTLDYTDHNNGCGSELFRGELRPLGCWDVGSVDVDVLVFHPGR